MAFTTKRTLLEKIKERDEISWNEFYYIYRPLIVLRGRDYNLQEVEIEELIQETILAIFKNCKKFQYDPMKGKFRYFLKTIINNKAIDIIRKRKENIPDSEDYFKNIPDTKRTYLEERWDKEWNAHIIKQALEELKNKVEIKTYQAFEMYVLEEEPPAKVAKFLDISLSSVYVSKNRAVEKLREIIQKNNML